MQRLIAIVLGITACSVEAAQMMFPVPKGAINPEHVVVVPGASEQDHFWLEEKYPGSSVLDHYKKVFSAWRPCPGREAGWSSFGEQSSGREQFVHQLLHHWVNPSNDTAIALALRYTSEDSRHRVYPQSSRQFVVVVRVKQKNASKMLAEMGAICAKDG